jgi:hypothetical protein
MSLQDETVSHGCQKQCLQQVKEISTMMNRVCIKWWRQQKGLQFAPSVSRQSDNRRTAGVLWKSTKRTTI